MYNGTTLNSIAVYPYYTRKNAFTSSMESYSDIDILVHNFNKYSTTLRKVQFERVFQCLHFQFSGLIIFAKSPVSNLNTQNSNFPI